MGAMRRVFHPFRGIIVFSNLDRLIDLRSDMARLRVRFGLVLRWWRVAILAMCVSVFASTERGG